MRNLVLAYLIAATGLVAQPVVTGTNPEVQLGNITYQMGSVRVYHGNGAPGVVTPPAGSVVQGDFYIDDSGKVAYQCMNSTCSTSNGWARTGAQVSVTAFGINGSTTDAGNFQNALSAASGVFCLYIPSGVIINMSSNHVTVPSNTCVTGDTPATSHINGVGLSTIGVGMLDIQAGSSNVNFSNLGIDGGVTTPTGILYSSATAAGPQGNIFTTGTSIWLHGAANNININNVLWNHTGGYAFYADATNGNITNVTISNSVDQNARPSLLGTSSLVYGSWNGGFLFHGTGATYNFQNIIVDKNTFQNVTGNCVWWSNGPSTTTLLNRSVRVSNNTFTDVGLDAIQSAWTEGYQEYGNKVMRFGYVITSDVGATRVGGPLWLQGKEPVAFDSFGSVVGFVRNNNWAEGNGGMFNLDGGTWGTISGNTFESCFFASDPLADSANCGPSVAVGQNFTYGVITNNSSNQATPQNIAFTGNSFNGVGYTGISLFPCQFCTVTGNTITMAADNGHPIVLSNISNLSSGHTTGTVVTDNVIVWSPGSGAPAIFEDGSVFAFSSSDVNVVRGNTIWPPFGNAFEFQHDTPDSSGSRAVSLNSVTPGNVLTVNGVILQAEGAGNPYLNFYLNNGAGTRLFTVSPLGNIPQLTLFVNLPPSPGGPGYHLYCTDCVAATTCAGGGSGHEAVYNGSAWNCN